MPVKCNSMPTLTPKQLQNFRAKVDVRGGDECWEWSAGCNSRGYGMVKVNKKAYSAHRLAYYLAKGAPGQLYVCHSCDNPKCCNPNHLWLGTCADNMRDSYEKGRNGLKGEWSKHHILTEKQVITIKTMLAHNLHYGTCSRAARKHSVSPTAISNIRTGRTWSHIHV